MSIFNRLVKSIYSPKDIAKFRLQGIGRAILYVFLLTLISILPAAIYLSTGVSNALNEAQNIVADEIPSFTINDGTLKTKEDEPTIIRKQDFTFIMDGSGELTSKDIEDYPNAIAFLEHQAIIVTGYQPQSFEYSMLEGIKLTDKEITSFINTFQSMLPVFIPLMILFMYIVSSATKFIAVTFFGLIALILKNMLGRNMKYRHAWMLAAYSMTLSTIFFAIMDAFKIVVPFSVFLTWFINIMIMYLAIKEIRKPKEQE